MSEESFNLQDRLDEMIKAIKYKSGFQADQFS